MKTRNGRRFSFDLRERFIIIYLLFNAVAYHGTLAKGVVLTESDWLIDGQYQYYVSSTDGGTAFTWHAARDFCMERSADLTSITSESEQDFIADHLNSTGYHGSLWHGLSRLQGPTWNWTDGESESYTNWAEGFPQEGPEIPWKCGYLESYGEWKNSHCDNARAFVCKRTTEFVSTEKTNPTTVAVQGYCPKGYFSVVNSNKCFQVVRFNKTAGEEGKTYDEAAALCRSGQGLMPDLGCIANENENIALTARLEGERIGFWIGLRRETGTYDEYRWSDNSPLVFVNWGGTEPSEIDEFCSEICVMGMSVPPGTWNDLPCTKLRGYVCQTYKDPGNPIATAAWTTQHQCTNGYIPYWYACYKLYTAEPKTWSEAEAACIADGGQLASIHSEPENSAVLVYLMNNAETVDYAWIGLEYLVDASVYYWSDSWHVVYTNWGSGQPNRTEGGGCVGIDKQGLWSDGVCSHQSPYLCKITTAAPMTTPAQMEGTCPDNSTSYKWFPYGEYCYGMTTYSSSWDIAQSNCLAAVPSRPCNLVSIHNSLESKFVGDTFVQFAGSFSTTFWIGLSKTGLGASHTWVDATEVEFINWAPGEPNDVDGSTNCVNAYADSSMYSWDDYYCSQYMRPSVCKVRKAPPPTTPPPPPSVNGSCPSDEWDPYGADCYLFRPDEYVTWDQADEDCRAFGSHLVTILDNDENWFVHHRLMEATWFYFVRQYWIGLSKQKDATEYLWADDASLDVSNYTNWMPGDPSWDNSRLCVELNGGAVEDTANSAQWTTQPCDDLDGYVCRVAKGSFSTSAPSDSDGGSNAGAIAGAIIGIIAGVALIVGGSFLGYRWYKNHKEKSSSSNGVSNVAFDNRAANGDTKNQQPTDPNQNYFGELESQDPASVRIGRLEMRD